MPSQEDHNTTRNKNKSYNSLCHKTYILQPKYQQLILYSISCSYKSGITILKQFYTKFVKIIHWVGNALQRFMQFFQQCYFSAIHDGNMLIWKKNNIDTSYNIFINSSQCKESMKFDFNNTPKYNAHTIWFYEFLLSNISLIEKMKQSIETPLVTIHPHLEGTHINNE